MVSVFMQAQMLRLKVKYGGFFIIRSCPIHPKIPKTTIIIARLLWQQHFGLLALDTMDHDILKNMQYIIDI
jgi:hypothetical protein